MEWIREARVTYTGQRITAPKIRTPEDVAAWARRIVDDARECFCAVYLDGRNQPIAFQRVSVGTATASIVHPREVFQPAVIGGAVAVVLVHNHPSGDAAPSGEDRTVTRRLRDAGELLGVRVLDHVIVGRPDGPAPFYSFQEAGELASK